MNGSLKSLRAMSGRQSVKARVSVGRAAGNCAGARQVAQARFPGRQTGLFLILAREQYAQVYQWK